MGLWEIQPQIILLVSAFAIGLVTGLFFDIYRRFRNLISPGPYLTAFGDLCFWSIITVITFIALLELSSGQVRGYVFFCIATGVFFYLHFFSPHVINFFVLLNIYTTRIIKMIYFLTAKVKKLKVFSLLKRIWLDAKRIYSKIKKK